MAMKRSLIAVFLLSLIGGAWAQSGPGPSPGTQTNPSVIVPFIYTPSAPSQPLTLTTGGTAQNLFSLGEVVHGCVITNPQTATETIWVNFFTTAVGAANSTAIPLVAGQSVGCPGGLTTAVSWIAATGAHAINAYKF